MLFFAFPLGSCPLLIYYGLSATIPSVSSVVRRSGPLGRGVMFWSCLYTINVVQVCCVLDMLFTVSCVNIEG